MISPSKRYVIVASPMCGCGRTAMPLPGGNTAGPMWSRNTNGPTMRRAADGSTRRTSNSPKLRIRGSSVSSIEEALLMDALPAIVLHAHNDTAAGVRGRPFSDSSGCPMQSKVVVYAFAAVWLVLFVTSFIVVRAVAPEDD